MYRYKNNNISLNKLNRINKHLLNIKKFYFTFRHILLHFIDLIMTEQKFGIATCSIIPLRKDPDERSEMTSQLLFGDLFEIKEISVKWSKIKTSFDNYYGWIDNKMYTIISESDYNKAVKKESQIINEAVKIMTPNNEQLLLPMGSNIPFDYNGHYFTINDNFYRTDNEIIFSSINKIKATLVKKSLKYINSPYLWGGKTEYGIDCSGLIQMVFRASGINLPRDASQQVDYGDTVSFVDSAEPGDVAFFDNENGTIIHVGLLLNNNKIIHSSGFVRIDSFDHQGIFNDDKKTYTHKLRIIKRMIP